MTTTAQNTKISPNFPPREPPRKCTGSADPWTNCIKNLQRRLTKTKQKSKKHRKTRRNFPILRNEQIQNEYKKSKNTKCVSIFYFFFRYIAESWWKSNGAYLSNVFFTKFARTFIRFPWFDSLMNYNFLFCLVSYPKFLVLNTLPTEYHSESSLRCLS